MPQRFSSSRVPLPADGIPTGRYRHWKGGIYRVLGLGILTETDGVVVVYVHDDGRTSTPMYFVRPLANFLGTAGPDGVPRFVYID